MNRIKNLLVLFSLLFTSCGEKYNPDYSTPERTLEAFVKSVETWDEEELLKCMINPEQEEFALNMQKDEVIKLYSGAKCDVLNYYNNGNSVVFRVHGKNKGGSLKLDSTGNWKIFVYMNTVANPFN